jgi:hypothetical protein
MSKERGSSVSDAAPDGLDRELGHSQSQEIIIKEKHHAAHPPPPQRSLARSIAIVATCTAAMIVNVRHSCVGLTHSRSQLLLVPLGFEFNFGVHFSA